ncbi:MAG: dicarboxylate/amino acid:cation symporter [Salinivirgaceae bacterium]|nr:MAG: dicarboxylate/amino acid:cation symporter [Salinivirgaceae bacterium]
MLFRKLALHWKILIGLALGIVFGFVASAAGWKEFTIDWVKPWGTIFIRMLKLIAVPLIFFSLVQGIGSLQNISKLSRMGLKTLALYVVSTVIAISVGLTIVNLIRPGSDFPEDKKEEFQKIYGSDADSKIEIAHSSDEGPLQFIVDIVPDNIIGAASNNINMLQVIFFAILFGIALVVLERSKVEVVHQFVSGVNDVIITMVKLIMQTAPYGVFALMGSLMVELAGDDPASSIQLLQSLGMYAMVVIMGLMFLVIFVYPILLSSFTKIKYLQFLKGIFPAQLLAFSTSSSAATLPVTMRQCENELGVSKEVSSFVLPVGATINMDGTSLYQAVAAVFIAIVFGYDLTLGQQLTIILTATLASIGSAAVPSAGIVMLVIVLESIGVPSSGIALIFAVDRPLDMLRTVVNVTGDSTIASIVAASENKLNPELVNQNKTEE